MTYLVKEIFFTLQGEGFNTGSPAVFCRFSGCNLWTGRENHRAIAVCQFCDTDFVGTDGPGGGHFQSASELAAAVADAWAPSSHENRLVVCTGGEPLLQMDAGLVDALHRAGFRIAVETNGTCETPPGIDWVCVSPKAGADLVVKQGDEMKLVVPQEGLDPASLESLDFAHFYVQPMDGPEREKNTVLAVEHCLKHPRWRLSLQTHKYLGIP